MKNKESEKITFKLIDALVVLRKQRNLSHEKLATLTGLHRSTISLIENKRRMPTILTCLKIARALNVELYEVLRDCSK